MNAGVRMTPCGVTISPSRAPASVAMRRKAKSSAIVVFIVDRRRGGLLVERLAIAGAAAQEFRPGRNGNGWIYLLREQRPHRGVVPAQIVPGAVPVRADGVAQFPHLGDQMLSAHVV